ncbi:MAG: hypothetical protein ABWX76_14820 [Leifsonia flava]
MNRFPLWGLSGIVAAIAITIVIGPNAAGSSADPAAVRPLSDVSIAGVAGTDADDPESTEAPPPTAVTVAAAPFGQKLTDDAGRTLYVYSLDPPGKSSCVGACARAWMPARSLGGKPQPGSSVAASSVGNIQRPDGSEQITFNGHPVYYYVGDTGPGQSNGNGRSEYGGLWSAKPPAAAGSK